MAPPSKTSSSEEDLEKAPSIHTAPAHDPDHDHEIVASTGPFAKVNRWFARFGIEERGVERAQEEDRDDVCFASFFSSGDAVRTSLTLCFA
jgi:hypothetical protein